MPNFCKDCKFVDDDLLKLGEDVTVCWYEKAKGTDTYISDVTGQHVERRIPAPNLCKYERAIGKCQDGKNFERKLDGAHPSSCGC